MKRTGYLLLATCYLLLASPAFAQLTDQTKVLEQVKAENPAAWTCAHTDRACAWDYIKIVACRLNPDGKGPWGLNGRRGDPAPVKMSWDALNYCGQGPAKDPTGKCAKSLTIIDVIRAAGSPDATIVWNPMDNDPTAGAWIKPFDCGPSPVDPPVVIVPPVVVVPPYPGDPVGNLIGLALFADYAEKGEAPNSGMVIWAWRCAWDMAVNRLPPDVAIKKHRTVWRAALGLPPLP
jgi:hypothetical protein